MHLTVKFCKCCFLFLANRCDNRYWPPIPRPSPHACVAAPPHALPEGSQLDAIMNEHRTLITDHRTPHPAPRTPHLTPQPEPRTPNSGYADVPQRDALLPGGAPRVHRGQDPQRSVYSRPSPRHSHSQRSVPPIPGSPPRPPARLPGALPTWPRASPRGLWPAFLLDCCPTRVPAAIQLDDTARLAGAGSSSSGRRRGSRATDRRPRYVHAP